MVRYLSKGHHDPESVARGVGLGLFVAFLPTIGLQVVLAFFLSTVFNANRIAAILGTFVTNPLTALPTTVASFWLGDMIFQGQGSQIRSLGSFDVMQLVKTPGQTLIIYLAGCLMLSLVASLVGYWGARFYFMRIYQRGRKINFRGPERPP